MIPLPNNLVSVQPMNGPSGHVYWLDYTYGNMENTTVNVSLFVTNLQLPNPLIQDFLIQDFDSYTRRIQSTVKKLDSLIGSLTPRAINYEGWRGDTSIVLAIRNTIGIYTIFSDEERRAWIGLEIPPLWAKEGDGGNTLGVNNVWQPWLGDKEIVHLGGKVVVSLSDTGVEYLNEIANRVDSLFDPLNNFYTYRDQ